MTGLDKFFATLIISVIIIGVFLFPWTKESYDYPSDPNYKVVVNESLWQSMFGKPDTVVYHKDNVYTGVLLSSKRRSHFVGVPGKGGHHVTRYDVVVAYGDRTVSERLSRYEYDYIRKHGVYVVERFYPSHNVFIKTH